MSADVAIVADDLTGAGDTAVEFSQAGWTAELRLREGGSDAQVIAVTTDSRACPDAEAAARVRRAVEGVAQARVRHPFKKIDSTARGPIRAEVDAMLDVLPAGTLALVCPAFPELGRTVVDGTLLVHGQPVATTAAGNDPVTPVTESHLPTLLDAPLVRLDPQGSPRTWAEQARTAGRNAGRLVVVVDAADDDELNRLAQTVVELGELALPVGSAGLAVPLARRWRANPPAATSPSVPPPSGTAPSGTSLVVVTSLNTTSREQARALAEQGAQHHEPSELQLTDDSAWSAFVEGVLNAAGEQPANLLITAPDRDRARVAPALAARRIAEVAAQIVRCHGIAGLVVTGGDGARSLLDGLDGRGIRLHGHVAPGVAMGVLVGGWAAGIPVATKAGGFGKRDILIRAADAVRQTDAVQETAVSKARSSP
ncbi:four-carbon acid sugar kinase family protein [Amycolatopsis palatopharyngis]|uniref:four-carbon acid sugar kinase family protein n=1 Tax=Amycolatopsis palatopharyngis TaxID=187982 RepID=UPI000E2381A3|nr:four-carbon acid sugar kinase family protein [Amycolatopsis palatopharyngis]